MTQPRTSMRANYRQMGQVAMAMAGLPQGACPPRLPCGDMSIKARGGREGVHKKGTSPLIDRVAQSGRFWK